MLSFGKVMTKVFGTRNDRLLKRYRRLVDEINALEPQVRKMTDAAMRARVAEIRQGLGSGKLQAGDVRAEAFAIMRESMDRHIGIREIFNPEQNFDPDKFNDENLERYDSVQREMIQMGTDWKKVQIPFELYDAVREIYPESRPPYRCRPFDVQIIGGLVLYEGSIAEMKTGEGKTFVGPLACFMKVLEGEHCHVVTVNDYLVRRDALWVKPAFDNLGITVGFIQNMMDPGGQGRRQMYECDITYGTNSEFGFDYLRDNMKERLDLQVQGPLDFAIIDEVDSILIDEARTPLIISGAAHDDAPKYREAARVAGHILKLAKPWQEADRRVDQLKRRLKALEANEEELSKAELNKRMEAAEKELADAEAEREKHTQYYEVEYDRKSVHMTHEGIAAAQEAAGVGSFYVGENVIWPHLMEQALRAHVVYERDKDYVIDKNPRNNQLEVVIVDEYTGRKMVGRQWSDGLHQSIEAKENVPIKQETQTLATITLQNFFKLYKSLAGMTGTAQTEAEEFGKIYKLDVVTIPTNKPVIRADHDDRVYRTEAEKWGALVDEVKAASDVGRPVLVGTTSVEKSEMLSKMLTKRHGVTHEVLNAKQHERESHIVAHAGEQHTNAQGQVVGNVTIATNMAGRGTDIKPVQAAFYDVKVEPSDQKKGVWQYTLTQRGGGGGGGGGETITFDSEDPRADAFDVSPTSTVCGGLHVIGTERHTSRRIDNQLRGRSGRQGDAGSSRFYVSLQDDLMKLFMGDWTINVMKKVGMGQGESIESPMLSKAVERAQKKVEERNYLARKNLLEYDEVMDHQRSDFYGKRQRVLEGRDVEGVIWEMIGESIDDAVEKYVVDDYRAAVVAEWARANLDLAIEPEDLKGVRKFADMEDQIKDKAMTETEGSISSILGEYMGEDPNDPEQWDTKSLSSWIMSRFNLQISQSKLKEMTQHQIEQRLKEAAREQLNKADVSAVQQYLEPAYPLKQLCNWAQDKFGVVLDPEDFILDAEREIYRPGEEIAAAIEERAREAYTRREIEFPVDHLLTAAFGPNPLAVSPEQAESINYVRMVSKAKWDADLPAENLIGQEVRAVRDGLIGHQERYLVDGELERTVDGIMKQTDGEPKRIAEAFNVRFMQRTKPDDFDPTKSHSFKRMDKPVDEDGDGSVTSRDLLLRRARNLLRQELTQLEQMVLISIFDQAWKDHLYAMDMLKGGIGLQAFAQQDPRVAYKREGYKFYREMLVNVRARVTDIVFRIQVTGQTAEPKSHYKETAARHDTAKSHDYGVNAEGTDESRAVAAGAAGQVDEGQKPKGVGKRMPPKDRNRKPKRK